MASGRRVGQRPDCHTFLCKFWHFQMAVSQWKLAWLTPNLGILWISACSFWLCESIVANPIIYRLVPRPSRFETRQWSPSGEVPHPLSGRNASDHWYLTLRHRIRDISLDPSVSLVFNLSFLLRSRCKSVQRSIAMCLTNGKQASKLLISQIKALIFSRSIAKWSTTRLPLVRSVSDYSAPRLVESSVVAWSPC